MPVVIASSSGDDTVQVGLVGHRPTFAGKVSLDGGAGADTLRNFDTATYAGKQYRVKKFESGMVVNPVTIHPDQTLADVRAIQDQHRISGIPVRS